MFSFKSVDFGNRIFIVLFFFSPPSTCYKPAFWGGVPVFSIHLRDSSLSLCKSESMSCLYSKSACVHNETLSWVAVLYN